VNYDLRTDITNYSGLRYGLQRQDLVTASGFIRPTQWKMDLPPNVNENEIEVDPRVELDELSHIPPGLITTYDQQFNVVSGANLILRLYPMDEIQSPRNLRLVHPSILGVDLGKEQGDDFNITGFRYMSSQSFPDRVRTALGSRTVVMPELDDGAISGITSQAFVDRSAINTLAIDAPIPRRMVVSDDMDGLLPLYVTLKIPSTNSSMISRWTSLLTRWREYGSIKTQFANNFSLYVHYPDGTNLDLFDWLQRNNNFDRVIKVFLDEELEVVTVSFIVMLMDGESKTIAVVEDSTSAGDNGFIVMRDGNANERWDTTFLTAPVGYIQAEPGTGDQGDGSGSGGGGGGGCGVGASALAIFLLCAAVVGYKKGRE
jgi:hypothetical protein